MKKMIPLFITVAVMFYACSNASSEKKSSTEKDEYKVDNTDTPAYDSSRGAGKFTTVDLPAKLDTKMADAGKKVYEVKCSSCHKLTDEKLVGPGWVGVTARHKAAWVMNFVTNTDEMINKDPKVQALLEICLVRMPNQSVSDEDARAIYEFMRQNDGVK